MRVVFAIDEPGQSSEIGEMLRAAIVTCRANTSLQPAVLAPRFQSSFQDWLESYKVECVVAESPLTPAIRRANARSGYPLQAAGNYLRYEACNIFDDEVILYTDCDVLFLKEITLDISPTIIAAGPEDLPDDYERINSGVLAFNVGAVREILPNFYGFASNNLERLYPGYDQAALNEFLAGKFDRLPVHLNWRPYWGASADAAIVHFHGVKPSLAELMFRGMYLGPSERRSLVESIVQRSVTRAGFFFGRLVSSELQQLPYFRKMASIIDRVESINREPLRSLCNAVSELRRDLEVKLLCNQEDIANFAIQNVGWRAYRTGAFQIETATHVRAVFSGDVLFLGLCDLGAIDGEVAATLEGATVGNIRMLSSHVIGDRNIRFVDVLDKHQPVDVIYHLTSDQARRVELRVYCPVDIRAKIYTSQSGQFREEESFWTDLTATHLQVG